MDKVIEHTHNGIDSLQIGDISLSGFPVTPRKAPVDDYQVVNKKYVDDNGPDFLDSTKWSVVKDIAKLQFSDDAEETVTAIYTDESSLVTYKEITWNDVSGTITVKGTGRGVTDYSCTFAIFLNSTIQGSAGTANATELEISRDITIATGDKIRLKAAKQNAGGAAVVKDFRIYCVKIANPTNLSITV